MMVFERIFLTIICNMGHFSIGLHYVFSEKVNFRNHINIFTDMLSILLVKKNDGHKNSEDLSAHHIYQSVLFY
jgi:hypothetical protein